MSERPLSHGVSAHSTNTDTPRDTQPTLTSASPAPPPQPTASATHRGPFTEQQRPRGLELPPLSRTSSANPGSFSPSATRIANVSSILNPLDDGSRTGHRRKASQLDSPIPSAQQLPPLAPRVWSGSGASRSTASVHNSQQSLSPRPPRRILTPRSPSALHPVASLGQLNPPAIINAQQVPFPPSPQSRVYSVEPGTSRAPPLPTPSARVQPASSGFSAPPASINTGRRASTGTNRPRNLSSSASPSTSYSSYSQAGQTSPMGPYASATGTTSQSAYSSASEVQRGQQRTASDPAVPDAQRMGIPISSSGGQNVYQMMTLETTSGTVQLPVDVQAASRVADEKRRRNAGASARFRQRRKEKEREASTSIARLEQQVKELAEDADFYRSERSNLMAVLRGIPGTEHHLQRPPSPRRIRGPAGAAHQSLPPSMGSRRTSYMRLPESAPQSPETGRNVRRRTSTFSLPTAPPSQLPPPGPPLQPNFPPSNYTPQIAPQPPGGPVPSPHTRQPLPGLPQRPPMQQQQPGLPPLPGPPSVLQTHPLTGPFNPYERRLSESGARDGR